MSNMCISKYFVVKVLGIVPFCETIDIWISVDIIMKSKESLQFDNLINHHKVWTPNAQHCIFAHLKMSLIYVHSKR